MDGIEFELSNTVQDEYDNTKFSELHTELLFYLEDKILYNTATKDELIIYEDYKLFNHFDFDSETCKNLIEEIQDIYENGYKQRW